MDVEKVLNNLQKMYEEELAVLRKKYDGTPSVENNEFMSMYGINHSLATIKIIRAQIREK